ncbi:MAG: hypothetical protein ACR2JE_04280 [Acidobacteriaceae bacterium]
MKRLWVVALLSVALLFVFTLHAPLRAQQEDAAGKQNDQKARVLLDTMVKALGGNAWLNLPGYELIGRTSAFYQGKPTGEIMDFFDYYAPPDKERVEFGKKRQVAQIFIGNEGWEVTYRGKRALPKDQLADYLRRRDHSVGVVIRTWLKDPRTILIYGGQETVERHLADKITLLSATNDNVTLELDAETHLPLRKSFEWRDPVYKDKNTEAEEYDDYHAISGFPTAFTVTRFHNDDMNNQRFLYNAIYGGAVPPGMFDPDAAAAKLKK